MSLNKVMLIGHLGKDPEIRYIDAGVCTAKLTLATSTPSYTLANGTVVPERTEWHNVILWRRLAEIAERYMHKGDKIFVEGELRYRTYTDKKGINHQYVEVWASNLEMLTPKSQGTTPAQPKPTQPVQNGNDSKCPF